MSVYTSRLVPSESSASKPLWMLNRFRFGPANIANRSEWINLLAHIRVSRYPLYLGTNLKTHFENKTGGRFMPFLRYVGSEARRFLPRPMDYIRVWDGNLGCYGRHWSFRHVEWVFAPFPPHLIPYPALRAPRRYSLLGIVGIGDPV